MTEYASDRSDDRSTVINLRAPKRQRDLVDRAAQILGKTRTDFILEAASRAAEEVLLDQRLFDLDEERYRKFIELLDEPPQENKKLQTLMRKSPPWST
ncbi:DUF1778 domain-containing protein [Azospirillum halopraeferens]|uniref:type II toxin-antitoxin system TacA family antitoxin n=1 Tax=Azospirillum halopraeferens TaxID=34010 RepID=UPI00048F3437|nr:DUF1778 domain-containing protein [Azospirillum halopraeferens]